jgi:hypothetical protein
MAYSLRLMEWDDQEHDEEFRQRRMHQRFIDVSTSNCRLLFSPRLCFTHRLRSLPSIPIISSQHSSSLIHQ